MNEEKSDVSHLFDEDAFAKAYSEALEFKSSLEKQDLSAELQNLDERYEVKELLGEGAVKKVFMAFDKLMDRNVALAKIKNSDPGLIDDFLREARLSSTLEHPYISPVYDMGFSEDGLPFFVMKLYDGQNLRDEIIQREKQSQGKGEKITWTLDIFLKVCEAVSFAHTKGVLHLDIKPSNIRINNHGEVLLCDWGIARLISCDRESITSSGNDSSTIISRATLTGEVRGTPGFMAPEQENPKTPKDERTDVYGLGALLHDMLAGEPPGNGKTLEQVNCPKEIEAICSKATARDPNKRYKNVQLLIDDITKYKSGMVTSAEKASSLSIIKKWALRHKTAVFIALFNILLVSAFLYVYIRDIKESKANLESAVDMLKVEREEQKQSQLDLAEKYFDQSFELYRNSVSSFDFDDRDINQALEMVIRSLDLDPTNKDAWALSGRLRLIQLQYDQAVNDFQKAGEKFKNYYEVAKAYEIDPELNNYENLLVLIRMVHSIRDQRLRNHIIFKGIHRFKNETLMKFGLECVAIVNSMESIQWTFDNETQTLDLSNNERLRVVYPLKTMRFERLNLAHTRLNSHELHNLRRIPLKYLNASYTNVKNLARLANEELIELNLQGSDVIDLSNLRLLNVKVLNVAKTKANLQTLEQAKSLTKIYCSPDQVKTLAEIFPTASLEVIE